MNEPRKIQLSSHDHERLSKAAADVGIHPRHGVRARIILMTSDGIGTTEIMKRLSISKSTVWRWQERFIEEGTEGLFRDRPRKAVKEPNGAKAKVIEKTCRERPWDRDQPFWMAHDMAWSANLAKSTVQKIWRDSGIVPHWLRHWRRIDDLVGFYADSHGYALAFTRGHEALKRKIGREGRAAADQWRQKERAENDALICELSRIVNLARSCDGRSLSPRQQSSLVASFERFLDDVQNVPGVESDCHVVIGCFHRDSWKRWIASFKGRSRMSCSFVQDPRWIEDQLPSFFEKFVNANADHGRFASVPALMSATRKAIAMLPDRAFRWVGAP